ncbi:hypothetical protein HETIRDRAFT_411348 [Heterobasidion irregulare TC 32-1]|uniref:Uncharacterized protein n=1 Tax=Heterobasidion irregulare (strain TC 32-1) TaxID=747525 RepID=W4JXV3_HETIT|nr:uncharacterized protein HETIRDRAFT_411348 [Heterobasidion irregulare TC 32-1]ETW78274.1 hypothetical protein HETIRDRAFT_411348 [Heterobasidion irregulare TC 32-1]
MREELLRTAGNFAQRPFWNVIETAFLSHAYPPPPNPLNQVDPRLFHLHANV